MGKDQKILTTIEERTMAAELIRRRLRVGFVRFVLTRVYQSDLRRIWREMHPGESTPAGCLPGSSISAIKTPIESAFAAAMLREYISKLRLMRQPSHREVDPVTL
ncbi:MAG: hypothetical protein L0H19_07885, partial [Salinisphaera sp.]|nr:hypothetical protein [Salinisphaera sp.]